MSKNIDVLLSLLRKTPKAEKIATIEQARSFKKVHAKATEYSQSSRHTETQTQSLISELQEYQ